VDNYNFVFFLEAFFEFNKIIYTEISKRENVKSVIGFVPKNKFMKILFRLHHSKTTNKFFSLPFKSLWFNSYFKNDFVDQSKPIVFIFDAKWMQYDYMRNYVVWLRKKFSGCKLVANYIDIVSTWEDCAKPDAIRHLFDILVTYDKDDAQKYNMLYHPTVYAEATISRPNNMPMTDVFFVGLAKNRMKTILDTYDTLEKAGLNCYFYVLNAKPSDKQERRGINYVDGKWLPYEDCIQYVQHTKCVLEIMQQGAKGETLRTWEAITYGKMLLTNNSAIMESKFYNPDYVSIISKNGEIETQRIKDYECRQNPLRTQITPEGFLRYISENL
jgi:hypothetical protein